MALTLLRHPEPVIESGICYGRSDIDAHVLNEKGLAELVEGLPQPIQRIDSSPLIRCKRLAEQLAATLALPVSQDPRLMEIDFGRWEMRPWDDIPRAEIDDWAADMIGARPHGGETVTEMTERARSYLDQHVQEEESVVAVTHLGFIRCAHAVLGHEDAYGLSMDYAEFTILEPRESL
ncbi:MAG: histidine phosphatase family protein [Pseudomonadota bacterium]